VRTCLIVDGSRVVRRIARGIVEQLAFEVDEAGDGDEALSLCKQTMPDAVVVDWQMPTMDGIEFLKNLRREPGGEHPKVIFCSQETSLDRIREALAAGADEYVMKPFDGDILAGKFALVGLAA
jgi:two-component system chemotaxis response regulator CheY